MIARAKAGGSALLERLNCRGLTAQGKPVFRQQADGRLPDSSINLSLKPRTLRSALAKAARRA